MKTAKKALVDLKERVAKMPWDKGKDKYGVEGAGTIYKRHITKKGFYEFREKNKKDPRYIEGVNLFLDEKSEEHSGVKDRCYYGTPNNVAIFKEVESVLNREYHFTFPWEGKSGYCHVDEMISVMDEIIAFMEDPENQEYTVVAWYY